MKVGTPLIAPEGLGSLMPNVTYYFAHSGAATGYATLISYGGESFSRTYFIQLAQEAFEAALLDESLVPVPSMGTLPPWLTDLEGIDLDEIEQRRVRPKASYKSTLDRRHGYIYELVKDPALVLASTDPMQAIAQVAKGCKPPQNPTRLAVWFAAYHLSGRNILALMPRYLNIGHWVRATHPSSEKKLGRPSLHAGLRTGYSAIPLADRIADAYQRFAKLGAYMSGIYRRAVTEVFGCKVATDDSGNKYFYHPQAKPFPSLGQFRYWVMKRYGSVEVRQTLYGAARLRAKSLVSAGTFASSVSNILERSEVDAFVLKDRPRCMLSENAAPALVVARGVCVATGAKVGIGFAFEKENSDSYRGMLFSMALPKSLFCALFGLDIKDTDWPCEGLPSRYITDRGPGAKDDLIVELSEKFPVRELAPSYSGQSKASIESSHPRDMHSDGTPTYVVSDLNVIEMIQREIRRAIVDNETSDVSSRLTPQMIADGVAPNPHSLWRYLDKRGRTDAQPMALPDAVRTFLKPVEFIARADGLYFQSQRFDSKELRDTGIIERMATHQAVTIHGYVYPLCVRTAWIECDGALVQVEAMLSLRDDKGQLYLSIDELAEVAKDARRLNRGQAEHKLAAAAEGEAQFKEDTGKSWVSGRRKVGQRPKTSPAAKQEAYAVTGKGHRRSVK